MGQSATAASIRPVIDDDDNDAGDAIMNMKQVIFWVVRIHMLFNVMCGEGVGQESLCVC